MSINKVEHWLLTGGALPWREINSMSLSGSLGFARMLVLEAFGRACEESSSFTWSKFFALDEAWSVFDRAYRLIHACAYLWPGMYNDQKHAAELAYVEASTKLASSRKLFAGLKRLKESGRLKAWQLRCVERSGFGVSAYVRTAGKDRQQKRLMQISELEKKCESNISSALDASLVWTNARKDLEGLPFWLVGLARERAKEKGWLGWAFHANFKEYSTFMSAAKSRELRRQMYLARSQAGSERIPEYDNAEHAKRILRLRRAWAIDSGYETYAHYALSDHMLSSPDRVESFLLDAARVSTTSAVIERSDSARWMKMFNGVSRLEPWDYRFANAEIRRESSVVSASSVEKYFAPIGTIERAVSVVADFLNVVVERDASLEVEDLLVFRVSTSEGASGVITVVPKIRETGDDMVAFEWTLSHSVEKAIYEVESSAIVFLQRPVSAGRLMNFSHYDVTVLFHELGHAFHAVLGRSRCLGESPSAIESDAIEFHSQLIECLAWDPAVLMRVGRFKGHQMPRFFADYLASLRCFHSGCATIAQVTDALCDLRLHTTFNPRGGLDPWEIMVAIKAEVGLDRAKSYNRQVQQMGAFTGNYVCSDYGYLWSEGLARKVYERWLQDVELLGAYEASKKIYQSLFALSGRVPIATQIEKYVGSKPSIDWLASARGLHE